ncbi:MAG: hypothetical protein ACREUA_01995, partial [Burkholderiales bacterium]
VLELKADFTLSGSTLEEMPVNPQIDASFSVEKGILGNFDLVGALQRPAGEVVRGGKTTFETLTGKLNITDHTTRLSELAITSGLLSASGNIDIAPDNSLSGTLALELKASTQSLHGLIKVSGELANPLIASQGRN